MQKRISQPNSITEQKSQLSMRFLFMITLMLSPLFMFAWQIEPLYSENQNTKFLHALANAGLGYLNDDWLAQTKDGLPLFTFWLEVIYAVLGKMGFYVLTLTSYAMFLFMALLIYRQISVPHDIPRYGLYFFLAFLFLNAAVTDLHATAFHGLASQHIINGYYQTADFGLFLILSVILFCSRKFLLAILSIILAAVMHPGYVAPGAMLIMIFMIYEFLPSADNLRAKKMTVLLWSFVGLVSLVSVALYLKVLFQPTGSELHAEAHRILTEGRIPHHSDPFEWRWFKTLVQFVILFLAVYLLPSSRLRFVLMTGFGIILLTIFIGLLPGTDTYRLIAPWRVSVVLVPLASFSILAMGAMHLTKSNFIKDLGVQKAVWGSVATIVVCVCVGSILTAIKFLEPTPVYVDFVRNNLKTGQTYLTSPGNKNFRLLTGAPQFVSFKSHPYQDTEVLEWQRRYQLSKALYKGKLMDCQKLKDLALTGQVSHVLILPRNPDVICSFATEVYKNAKVKIYDISVLRAKR